MTARTHRWDQLETDRPMPGIRRRRIIGEKVMISEILLEKGAFVPSHEHENEQMACVVSGRIRFGLGAEGSSEHREIDVGAGEVLHLPSHVPHSALALDETLVLDVFSPPSEATGVDTSS